MSLHKDFNILLADRLRSILPDGVISDVCPVDNYGYLLSRIELEQSKNYKLKRLSQFSAGRYLAKKVLSVLDIESDSISKSPSGAPEWPQGIVGSISHTDSYCLCAIANQPTVRSLGIDLERTGQLSIEDAHLFMSDNELNEIKSANNPSLMLTVAFSIRESVYKCLNPIYNKWIDYTDAKVEFHKYSDANKLDVNVKGYENLALLKCRYTIIDDMVITSAVMLK